MKQTFFMQTSTYARFAALIPLLTCLTILTNTVHASPPSSDLQAKITQYKQKLQEWAANPAIIAAIKVANIQGPGGMTNVIWDGLNENDERVKALQTSKAGQLVSKWEEDTAINKLYIRDMKGNLVASSNKALFFNNASRPPFKNSIKGQVWSADDVQPDPTTMIMSVQISVPIVDKGQTIGVMNSSVTAR